MQRQCNGNVTVARLPRPLVGTGEAVEALRYVRAALAAEEERGRGLAEQVEGLQGRAVADAKRMQRLQAIASRAYLGLQPRLHRVAASLAQGCGLAYIGLRPRSHRVAASFT